MLHLLNIFYSVSFSIDRLTLKDAQIVQSLTEKLQLFAELAESVAGLEDTSSRSRLLLRGDASDLQQGEQLLKGAITEGNTSEQRSQVQGLNNNNNNNLALASCIWL